MARDRRNEAWAGAIASAGKVRGSALLSHCITCLTKARSRPWYVKVFLVPAMAWWYIVGEREAGLLEGIRVNLGHDALNVLANWRNDQRRIWKAETAAAMGLAKAEAAYEKGEALPHQVALAYTEMAKAISWWLITMETDYQPPEPRKYVRTLVDGALALVPAIRAETDQPQGLRQLARVYKHLHLISSLMGWPREAAKYLHEAERAAQEGDTGSQVADIARLRKRRA